MRTSVVAAGFAVLLAAISFENRACAENLVLNGGFEEIQPFPQPFVDWTVIEGFTQYLFPVPVPHSGDWAAGFAATHQADDTLLQFIPTAPGGLYQFDFWLTNPDYGEPPDNDFAAVWNGAPVLALINAPYFPYTHYVYTVQATGTQTELRFIGANSPGGFALDDVSVVSVCEPSSFLLGLGAVGSVLFWRVLRKRRAIKCTTLARPSFLSSRSRTG